MRRGTHGAVSALLALCMAAPLGLLAQGSDPLAQLDATTRHVVQVLMDSARSEGLPTQPILSKAQEGISKHVDGPRIAAAVRTVFLSLRGARTSLGAQAAPEELKAGAFALQAGIPEGALQGLHKASHGKSVTVPLIVLTDLVTRGVPSDTASNAILQLWTRGAGDADLLGLPKAVGQDILSGAAPGDALLKRARTIPLRPPGKGSE
ncbi:MAG TPA: hypothetical protein VFK16_04085 [Gemmatimonadaceae bacterium]|jgi:hypothetical protein|nr:hypothetical protein [Gemmatimonadaceae bacterium]